MVLFSCCGGLRVVLIAHFPCRVGPFSALATRGAAYLGSCHVATTCDLARRRGDERPASCVVDGPSTGPEPENGLPPRPDWKCDPFR